MADHHRRRDQAGSALVLVPALVLVALALGGIGVDLALVHMARRSAYRSLSAAVDDAAGMVDARRLQLDGEARLDPGAAERVVRAHLGLLVSSGAESWAEPAFEVTGAEVLTDPDAGTVSVTATVRVEHILLAAVPGVADSTDVRISSVGRLLG